jgi:hypothetical protein
LNKSSYILRRKKWAKSSKNLKFATFVDIFVNFFDILLDYRGQHYKSEGQIRDNNQSRKSFNQENQGSDIFFRPKNADFWLKYHFITTIDKKMTKKEPVTLDKA